MLVESDETMEQFEFKVASAFNFSKTWPIETNEAEIDAVSGQIGDRVFRRGRTM